VNEPTQGDCFTSPLTGFRVHSRFFIGVPVQLIGQTTIMESRFRMVMQRIFHLHVLEDAELQHMDTIIACLHLLRDPLSRRR